MPGLSTEKHGRPFAANAAGKQEAAGALPLPVLRAVLGYDAYDAEAKPYRLPD
ncbi:MAG: hypothetical protein ACKOEE_15045 [Tagaea sp.]